jgi:probable HAF family extracellular repeat protein
MLCSCMFLILSLCAMERATAQVPACTAGTLANVINSSCSIGSLTFNFQNDFNATVFVFNQGTSNSRPLSPAEISFIPLNSGNLMGFKLVTNIVEGPGPEGAFLSTHDINFSYTPQANPGFVIQAEKLSLDTTVQNPGPDSAITLAADDQCYSNGVCTQVFPRLLDQSGSPLLLEPSKSINLEVPSLLGVGSFLPGVIPTTTIQSVAAGQAQATLTSASFIYTVATEIAAPRLAHLNYSNIDLPDVATTLVSNINNAGRIVGTFQDSAGASHGYVTQASGGLTVIDFPGSTATFANGLNDHGDVVGSYTDSAGVTHGFLMQDGSFTTIDVPNSTFSFPIQINNKGEIVGFFRTADHKGHGFLQTRDGFTIIDQGPTLLRGAQVFTEATGINNKSTVVGAFFDPNTLRSFQLNDGGFEHFDVPGQGDAFASGISDHGEVVGSYNDINLASHGFVLSRGLFRTVDFPGGNNSFALGVNASGQIVGEYFDDAGATHSFLAEPRTDDDNETGPNLHARPLRVQPNSCSDIEWDKHPERHRQPVSCTGDTSH